MKTEIHSYRCTWGWLALAAILAAGILILKSNGRKPRKAKSQKPAKKLPQIPQPNKGLTI